MIKLIILSRTLDVLTTFLNVNRWGDTVEFNSIVRSLISIGWSSFLMFQVLMTILIIWLWLSEYKPVQLAIKIFVGITFIVAFSNLLCFLVI